MLFFCLLLLTIPLTTYHYYFGLWAQDKDTYYAFDTNTYNLGVYLNSLPQDIKKYVIVNRDTGVWVRGLPMPVQPILFATDTFTDDKKIAKNFEYVLPGRADKINIASGEKAIIVFLNSDDKTLIASMQKKFPAILVRAPGDFVVLTTEK